MPMLKVKTSKGIPTTESHSLVPSYNIHRIEVEEYTEERF